LNTVHGTARTPQRKKNGGPASPSLNNGSGQGLLNIYTAKIGILFDKQKNYSTTLLLHMCPANRPRERTVIKKIPVGETDQSPKMSPIRSFLEEWPPTLADFLAEDFKKSVTYHIFFGLFKKIRTFAMSFRGSCPEPLFYDGEARSPIFFSSRSNGNIHR